MEKINLKICNELDISISTSDSNQACTCYYCSGCIGCILFVPLVGVVLAPVVAAGLILTRDGGA